MEDIIAVYLLMDRLVLEKVILWLVMVRIKLKYLIKGLVPIMCSEIFNRMKNNKNEKLIYEVWVSMMEIYNEKLQDLLV